MKIPGLDDYFKGKSLLRFLFYTSIFTMTHYSLYDY